MMRGGGKTDRQTDRQTDRHTHTHTHTHTEGDKAGRVREGREKE